MMKNEYLKSATYRSGFFNFISRIVKLHDWISQNENRKKWAFRIFLVLLYLEITIHIAGIGHFEESKNWWKNLPMVEKFIELIF